MSEVTVQALRPVISPDDSKWRQSDSIELAIVLVLCIVAGYARWLKMESLVWDDPARWLFESSRVATGEMPYRDFSWQYPPFALFVIGWAMKWFGVRFLVAQIVIEVISLSVVLVAFTLARYVLPRKLRLATMFLFIAVCATSQMKFALFSFVTYVPALQTGAAGCMLALVGVLHYLRSGIVNIFNVSAMMLGTFVGALSKPETLAGSVALLGVLAIADRHYWFAQRSTAEWIRRYSLLLAACFIPVLLAYLGIAMVTGTENMVAGLTGYGLASEACPWWPTGLGIFGAMAALGQAMVVAAVFSLITKTVDPTVARGHTSLMRAAPVALLIYLVYLIYLNGNLHVNGSWATAVRAVLPTLLWTNAVLIPVMWASLVCYIYLLWRMFSRTSRQAFHSQSVEVLILLTAPVLMCTRGLFNSALGPITEVPAICYPFFLILGPYLLWRFIQFGNPGEDRSLPVVSLLSLLIVYGVIRVAGAYAQSVSTGPYETLTTRAGNIRLHAYSQDAQIYRFVMDNTLPGDTVLDVPYGGGMNMATGRASPTFTTEFRQLRMPVRYMQKDLEQISAHPPKVVIGQDEPNYGTQYGVSGNPCAFPKIVWSPPFPEGDPRTTLPLVDFINAHYKVSRKVGPKLLLVLK